LSKSRPGRRILKNRIIPISNLVELCEWHILREKNPKFHPFRSSQKIELRAQGNIPEIQTFELNPPGSSV